MKVRTHWKRWLVGGVLAAAVLAVGVPYAYIHLFNSDQPAPLTVSTSAAPATGTVDGTWTIGTGSQAGYRVHEVLGGQSTEAVGRTSGVTGTATISGSTVTAGAVTVDLTTVTSDESQRDSRFTGSVMNTAEFPTATFTLDAPLDLGAGFTTGSTATVNAAGTLTVHGVTHQATAALTATRNGTAIDVAGSVPVTFADYGVTAPSIGSFVTVDPAGQIEFLLKLAS